MVWLEAMTLERVRRLDRIEKIGKKVSDLLETRRLERIGKIGW